MKAVTKKAVGSKQKAVRKSARLLCLLPTAYCLLFFSAFAQYANPPQRRQAEVGLPPALRNVGIDQRLNEQAPLDLVFRDEGGQERRLGEYFGRRPVILALVYYECPMLCNQVLNGLVSSLKGVSYDAGRQFDVVVVSFDPRETPALAAKKKETYLKSYKRTGAESGWHFLTGEEQAIEGLTRAVGFRYVYDPQTKQFAHASAIMILTPQGKVARYLFGIDYPPRDVRFGLIEASEGKVGSPVDRALLFYCYHWDPASNKYAPIILNLVRLGGVVTLLGVAALVMVMRRRVAVRDRARIGGTA